MPVDKAKKIISRVKTAAREARDLPTAWATSVAANDEYRSKSPFTEAKLKSNVNASDKNWERQVKEAAAAILRGEKGTSSDQLAGYSEYIKGKSRRNK
jgi:hypothetical protein